MNRNWLIMMTIGILMLVLAALACTPKPTASPTPSPTSAPTVSTSAPTTAAPKPTTPTPAPSPTKAPIKLRFATANNAAPPSFWGNLEQSFLDDVTKRSGGRITFETLWGGTLGDQLQHISMLNKGVIDIGVISFANGPDLFPLSQFPYAFPIGPSDATLHTATYRQMIKQIPQLEGEWTKNNIKVLSLYVSGQFNVDGAVPLNTLADFKGRKIVTVSRWIGEALKAGGAIVVSGGIGQRYEMLQRGVADLDCLGTTYIKDIKLYEVAKYLNIIGLSTCASSNIAVNLDKWKSLSAEDQQIFLAAGEDNWLGAAKAMGQAEKDAIDFLKGKGMTVVTLPDAEVAKWAQAMPDIAALWAQETMTKFPGLPTFEVAKAYQDISGQLGYKWSRQWGIKK